LHGHLDLTTGLNAASPNKYLSQSEGAPLGGANLLVLVALVFVISFAAISSESLWIDEGLSAYHVQAETATELWRSLAAEGNSNLQLPLYHFYLWSWAQMFGTSEVSLRGANIPLLFLVFGALVYLLHNHASALNWTLLVLLSSAMLWAYLDECRPYMMILAASAWSIAAGLKPLLARDQSSAARLQTRNTRILLFSLLWLSACSMIALPWCLTIFLAWLFIVGTRSYRFLLGVWPTALLCILLLAGILAYYAWTLSIDARATPGQTNFFTMAFAIYENVGLSGFGPSRQLLREAPLTALQNYAGLLLLPTLAVAISFALMATTAFFSSFELRKFYLPLLVISTAFLIIQFLGIVGDVRILGRHVIPVLMVWCLALGIACADSSRSTHLIPRLAPSFILLVFLASSLLYRFGSNHQKDNYRDAAAWALEQAASGKQVLWAADSLTGKFYGLNKTSQQQGRVVLLRMDEIPTLTKINAIALSKPDIYDPHKAIRRVIDSDGYEMAAELKSFTLWVKRN